MGKLFNLKLIPRERIAFRLHLSYSAIEGIILGILALNEFVFIKSMAGKPIQLAFLFQFSMLVFLLSAFVHRFFSSGKRVRKLIRITALITRLPMVVFLFFPETIRPEDQTYNYLFLGAFLLYYLANPLIYPNINHFLRNSYQHHNFGFLYSMSTSFNKIIMMIVTFVYGLMLDHDPMVFRYVLPLVGVLAVVSAFLLTMIPFKDKHGAYGENLHGDPLLKNAFKNIVEVLRQNKAFFMFQVAFMFYGLSFMIGMPATNLFYKEILELNYSSVAFYRNAYNIVAIAALPFMGRLLGKTGPMRFGVITFASLLFYFLFVILTGLFPWNVTVLNIKIYHIMIIALVFHGLFASTMSLLWNIGSSYFGKNENAARLQNVHLFLTGIRAIPAPILGIWLYEAFGYVVCFSTTLVLLCIGILVIRRTLHHQNEAEAAIGKN